MSDSPLSLRDLRQNDRLMKLHFPNEDGPSSALLIESMKAEEELSRSFSYTLELLSDDAFIETKELMGVMMTVELEQADGSARYFNGYVTQAERTGSDGGYCLYQVVLSPWTHLLHNTIDNYTFQEQTLTATLDEIFADYGVFADYDIRVYGKAEPETFRAQGGRITPDAPDGESDYNYLHRRLEEKGWYYWFEHRKDGHTLVISDNSEVASSPIDGTGKVRFHNDKATLPEDTIQQWKTRRTLAPGKVSVTSFDFKHPRAEHQNIKTRNQQGRVLQTEVHEYTGAYGFKDFNAGRELAKLRMEEIESRAKCFEAKSNCRLLQPGRTFELLGHFAHDKEDIVQRKFLIQSVRHEASNNYLQGNEGKTVYDNTFIAQRKIIPYRPGRGHNSKQPRRYGVQNAVVVGRPGEEIDCDEYGRVYVQFPWDRKGQYDHKSSCRVRVASTWAGSNFGAISLPRVGQEVLVTWVDGNPDLPIIIGSVFNQANMPPWELPANKTQTGILSRSTQGGHYAHANALRFEDKKGEEQLWLHAEKDQLTEVEHDEDKWVGNDRKKTIDRDETSHIKRNRSETVDNDESITIHHNRTERVDNDENISIGANRTEDVGRNETLHVGANRTEHIGANHDETIGANMTLKVALTKNEMVGAASTVSVGGAYALTVGAAMNTAVGLAQFEEVGLDKTVLVGRNLHLKAGDELKLEVGKSCILMRADGHIRISGVEVLTDATKKVEIHGDDVDINPN